MKEENEIQLLPEHQFPDFIKVDTDEWAAEFKHHLIDLLVT